MSMTLEQAIRILHPETRDVIQLSLDEEAGVRVINEACLLACEVMQREVARQNGCPSCPVSLGMGFKHCPRCGKLLNDWKVVGDELE